MEGPGLVVRVLRATAVLLVGLGVVFHLSRSPARPSAPELPARAAERIAIPVADLDRSVEFYSTRLFFEKVSDAPPRPGAPRRAQLRLGDEVVELVEALGPKGPSALSAGAAPRFAIIVSDIDQVYLWLARHRVGALSPRPPRLEDLGGRPTITRSFTFRDSDGHLLEVRHFAPGEGDWRWGGRRDRIFLGVEDRRPNIPGA